MRVAFGDRPESIRDTVYVSVPSAQLPTGKGDAEADWYSVQYRLAGNDRIGLPVD